VNAFGIGAKGAEGGFEGAGLSKKEKSAVAQASNFEAVADVVSGLIA